LPTNQDTTKGCFDDFLVNDYVNAPASRDKGKQRAMDPAFDSEMPDPYTPSVSLDIVGPVSFSRPAISSHTRSKSVTLDAGDIEDCSVPDATSKSLVSFVDTNNMDELFQNKHSGK
jgi:hypothetical protein